MSIKESRERFNVNIDQGLSYEQVELRKKQKLVNKSKKAFGKSYAEIIISNLFSVFNILLYVIAGVMIFFTIRYNEPRILSGMFFVVVLLCNTIIGLYHDIKARLLLNKLSLTNQSKATVIRNGKEEIINAEDIVLDDVVLVEKNSQISVDGIVLHGELGVNESFITGESSNVFKKESDEVFSGTIVTNGKAYIRVEKVGPDCLANSLQTKANKIKRSSSEILRFLKNLILVIGIGVIAMAVFMIITFAVQGKFANDELTLKSAESISGSLIAMIPSVLYLLTSITLAISVIILGRKKAQVQDLYSVETLARVNTLCLDKTGIITDGNLIVKKVIPLKASYLDGYIAQAICNVIRATGDKNATASALLSYFDLELSAGVNVALPFNSTNKYFGASFKGGKTFIIGAPEYMPIINQAGIIKRCEEFTKDGYRVVVLGEGIEMIKDNKYPGMLEPVALIVVKDHIREDVIETLAWFKDNGVDIKVVSGDNVKTVSSIATEAGIANAHKSIYLEGMPIGRVKMIAKDYTVFGRATPEQKEALIIALKESQKTVAMAGDGVNDILALKRSDCSISMASSVDAAKNVSQIILMDSNFSQLRAVVDEGRRVVNNLQRIASLFVAKSIFAFVIAFIFMMASIIEKDSTLQYPFIANQLFLWEIIISGFAALFLVFERNNEKIKGRFLPNVLKTAIPAAILLVGVVCTIFLIFVLQRNGLTNLGVYSRECAVAMSIIVFSVLGTVFLYEICLPLNKYRRVVLVCSASASLLALIVTAIVSYIANIIEPVLQIPFIEMDGVSFITTLIVAIAFAAIYLFVYQIISIVKKEDSKDEN